MLALLSASAGYTDRGILKLDNATFDRLVDGSRNIMVRFDKEYSYGDDHDAWKDFAKTVGDSSADVLIADVGVSEYGDKDNSDLSDRYSIKSDDFPSYRFWAKGAASSADPVKYEGAKKKDDFLRFIQEKAGAWIGLAGQVKELDALAKEFVGASDKKAVLAKAEAAAKGVDGKDADSAKYYVKVMTKGADDAGFVGKEMARLTKMMDDGSVKPAKKEQFGRRLNMLSSFS
uniref:Endoplasmic reticulum resident protein 29 C-terminal domain-containing protein n=1 Tax=Prymnesium polylepis TaxID=72548 RepID=A0A6T8AFN6_9EUKA|mmetsp:Transcript_33007/g.82413  ORF Transcript_33007/g.82413 Transcript_33007/m.82413 type:complete len:231 (+) Transcript_33007:52-744(+)